MTRDVLRQRLRLHPHLRLGPVILSNERGGIIPLIVVGSFFSLCDVCLLLFPSYILLSSILLDTIKSHANPVSAVTTLFL